MVSAFLVQHSEPCGKVGRVNTLHNLDLGLIMKFVFKYIVYNANNVYEVVQFAINLQLWPSFFYYCYFITPVINLLQCSFRVLKNVCPPPMFWVFIV